MTVVARLLAGAIALLFMAMGLRCMFAPVYMGAQILVHADGAAELST